jgi:hypothetical protein
MTPIKKARVKSEALSDLGLHNPPTYEELRRAWRQRAFETHPDRTNGDLDAFIRVKAAFELLASDVEIPREPRQYAETGKIQMTVTPRRPSQAKGTNVRIETLSKEDKEDCFAILASQPKSEATDHVVEEIHRQGRHLVYITASEFNVGQNRIALPAQFLVTNRKVDPSIVNFYVTGRIIGDIVIPEDTRLEVFPGARSVRIRFRSNFRRH